MANTTPQVSLIIPAYQSQDTIAASLRTFLAQDYPAVEIIIIDSSPDTATEAALAQFCGGYQYHHHTSRLLPHAARNQGVSQSSGELLVFSDPDIYAPPDWISRLVRSYQQHGGVIVGALDNYGQAWIDWGMHLCKFDKWLPGGQLRPIDVSPTANMLCSRTDFERAGGFDPEGMLSDTTLSWAFHQAGIPLWFDPQAVVAHHHLGGWLDLLQERYKRGAEFGQLRLDVEGWRRARLLGMIVLSVLPVRLVKLTGRGLVNAARARLLGNYFWASPLVVSGQAAWLMGELQAYFGGLRRGA